MTPSYYFFDSYDISVVLYSYCTDWKTKLEYALLNTKMCAISFSQKSNLNHEFKSDPELSFSYNLPIATATSITFRNSAHINALIFDKIFKKNVSCVLISIATDCNLTIDTIQKLSKLCAKKNIRVHHTGPQTKVFEEFLTKYKEVYMDQFKEYSARGLMSSESNKKRKKDTVMMEVPADRSKRLKFLLTEASKLVEDGSSISETKDISAHSDLQRVLNYDNQYQLFCETTAAASTVDFPFLTMSRKAINNTISNVADTFIDCIMQFDKIKIYVTSGDVFLHNHITIGDCAYGINDENCIYDIPTAVIKENTYLGSTTYYELSIHWGFIEVLVTRGFYSNGQSPQLFLGSSIRFWKYGELTSSNIFVLDNAISRKTYGTPRLLNQYNRRDSHRPWDFHSMRSFVRGYTPSLLLISLAMLAKKKKKTNIAHFASKLLYMITAPNINAKSDIINLFLFFTGIKFFLNTCKKNQDVVINFLEFQRMLKKDTKTPLFNSFLVDIAVMMKNLFNNNEACYVFSMLDNVQNMSLKIVKDGLKRVIVTETNKIVKSYV